MKLNFKDYTDLNGVKHLGFYIADNKYIKEIPEQFIEKNRDKMRTFNELYLKERAMVQERKVILKELKIDFSKFLKKEYPEFYI
jgi:hypothetical protein